MTAGCETVRRCLWGEWKCVCVCVRVYVCVCMCVCVGGALLIRMVEDMLPYESSRKALADKKSQGRERSQAETDDACVRIHSCKYTDW